MKGKYKKRLVKAEEDEFPTITENNIDTWNDITYTFIIRGMLSCHPDLQYGDAMTKAGNLTNKLFRALKVEYAIRKRIDELKKEDEEHYEGIKKMGEKYNWTKKYIIKKLSYENWEQDLIKELQQLIVKKPSKDSVHN